MRAWAVVLAVLLCAGPIQAREPERLQIKWDGLAARVVGKKIATTTAEGVSIQGRVIAVEADGLRMDVSKTSGRKTIGKGSQLIARRSVTTVQITEYRNLGRIIGTAGSMGVVGAIVAAHGLEAHEGVGLIVVPIAIAGGIIGAGIAGYFVGKSIDKRVTVISIVP